MNLTELLPIGRCVKQSKTVFGKYKLTQQTLPKFASTVRPTTSSPIAKALLKKADSVAAPNAVPIAMGSTGHRPVPSGDPSPGTGKALELFQTSVARSEIHPIPPGQWTDGTNGSSVLPIAISESGLKPAIVADPLAPDETQNIPTEKVLVRSEESGLSVEPVLKKDAATLATRIGEKISAIKKKLRPVRSKKKSGAAVQTEWALGVQVARNDLSDADLEVVAPKKGESSNAVSAHSSTPKRAGLNQAKSYGYRWIKKTAGLFSPSSPFEKSAPEEAAETPAVVKNSSELVGRI